MEKKKNRFAEIIVVNLGKSFGKGTSLNAHRRLMETELEPPVHGSPVPFTTLFMRLETPSVRAELYSVVRNKPETRGAQGHTLRSPKV